MRRHALTVFLAALALSTAAPAQNPPRTFSFRGPSGERQFTMPQGKTVIPRRDSLDPKINIAPLMAGTQGTCFKLRKYIFAPTPANPDQVRPVGETDCTYAGRVQPRSAQEPRVRPAAPGIRRTVLKPAAPQDLPNP